MPKQQIKGERKVWSPGGGGTRKQEWAHMLRWHIKLKRLLEASLLSQVAAVSSGTGKQHTTTPGRADTRGSHLSAKGERRHCLRPYSDTFLGSTNEI